MRSGLMRGGINPRGKLAGKMLVRLDAILGAGIEKYFQRDGPFAAQAFDILGIKVSAAVQPDKFSPEHLDIGVERDNGLIVVDFPGCTKTLKQWETL